MEEKSFFDWYTDNEKEAGALVSMTVAGKMLETTRQYVQNLVNAEKIKVYDYNGMKFVGLREIEKVIKRRIERFEKDSRLKRASYITAKEETQIDYEEMIKFIKETCPDKAKEFGL